MDKIQKIGTWIWDNKERMVLVVMVLVLGYRVYEILSPPPPPDWPRLQPPRRQLPEEPEYREELGLPSEPPARPPMDVPGTYATFHSRNPFWYHSRDARPESGEQVRAEDLNIQLLDIQDVGGNPRARLRSARTTAWYSTGEQFEEFEVLEINVDTDTVVVYSERYARPFTLRN